MKKAQSEFSGRALVVTVNENLSPSISSLGPPVLEDGNAVTETLIKPDICGYTLDRVIRLSGNNATLASIEAAFHKTASSLGSDDPFLFFYSGHGGLTKDGGILAPYDADLGNRSGILSSADLARLISIIPSNRKMIVIDACHAGSLNLFLPTSGGSKSMSSSVASEMKSGEGAIVLASSRSSETSFIKPGDSLSLFTKHFVASLEGAAGHDAKGFVRVFDVFNYVTEQVNKADPRQRPVYAAHHQDSNFAIAYCTNIKKRIAKPTLEILESGFSDTNYLLDMLCALYPLGPSDQELWTRAGGDLSRLNLEGSGRLAWSRAIRDMMRGSSTTIMDVVREATKDYPFNRKLQALNTK